MRINPSKINCDHANKNKKYSYDSVVSEYLNHNAKLLNFREVHKLK